VNYLQEAWGALIENRVRSLLTIVGLIIGVGAVIAIQMLGSSMAGAVNGALGGMADNSFILFPSGQQRDVEKAAIRLSDLAPIQRSVPGIAAIFPLVGQTQLVRAGHARAPFAVTSDGAISLSNLPVQYGRHFTREDVTASANVTVISDDAYHRLFPAGGDPTGTSLYVGSRRYEIVGVQQPPKRGFINAQFGGGVTLPWTTYIRDWLQGDVVGGAAVVAQDPAQIPEIETAVERELRDLHGDPQNLQYQTLDKAKLSRGIGSIFNALTIMVGLIGAVSLLVAGIGIMNIMLVSVAERTHEIGVRKAIGARRSQILWQFFLEAFVLCASGCAIGLAIGLAIGDIVNDVFIVKLTGTVTPIPWPVGVMTASAFAVVVTLAFGTYPAFRAAQADPIEALRYE
jgi:putative ABC transport system permease protein